ncbi:hypothetical protein HDU81_000883, partial [Chytriomyces hyalinus]
MNLQHIPTELHAHIFHLLDPFDAVKYRRVCRSLNDSLTSAYFSNAVSLVHVGTIGSVDLFCFVTTRTCRSAFLTQVHATARASVGHDHLANPVQLFPAAKLQHTLIPANPQNEVAMLANYPWIKDRFSKMFRFVGPPPDAMDCLRHVTVLALPRNLLTGCIPTSICDMVQLKVLDLEFNKLTGPIPPAIGNLVNLEKLNLRRNMLTGSIPASAGKLVNLSELKMCMNALTGVVPDVFGRVTKLKILSLAENKLEGTLPESLGTCAQLTNLDFSRNQFSGSVPESIFRLSLL